MHAAACFFAKFQIGNHRQGRCCRDGQPSEVRRGARPRARARGGVTAASAVGRSRGTRARALLSCQLSALCPYEQRTHIFSYSHMIGAETR